MKLRNLREEMTSGDGGFSDGAKDPVAGMSIPMGVYGTGNPAKRETKKEQDKFLAQIDQPPLPTFEQFRNQRQSINEWYVDDYEISYVETEYTPDGVKDTPKIMTVKNNIGGVTTRNGKLDNTIGHMNLKPDNVEICTKCGSTNCQCNSSNYRRKEDNLKKKIDDHYLDSGNYLKESGGGNIDLLQQAVEDKKPVNLSFKDGTTLKVDPITAAKVLEKYEEISYDASALTIFRREANDSQAGFKEIVDSAKGKA